MPTPLTTPIAWTSAAYELTAGNFDFVGQTLTLQIHLLDAGGAVVETITRTRTFAELGISAGQANAIRTAIIARMTTEGVIN